MDKKRIVDETKSIMFDTVESLDIFNVEEVKNSLVQCLEFIKMLQMIPETKLEQIEKDLSDNAEEDDVSKPSETEQLVTESDSEKTEQTYKFMRKLKGGLLQDLDGGYPIPETMVRSLGIEHGDLLRIVDVKERYMDTNRYWFEIAEKGVGEPNPERAEEQYCLVEEDTILGFVVRQDYLGNELRIGNNPYTFRLRELEVSELKLKHGDVIDIAYYKNNLSSVRIVWKYDILDIQTVPTQQKAVRKMSSAKREHGKGSIVEGGELFKDKTILVIGAKPKESIYRDMLEELGAEIKMLTGYEAKSMVRSNVKSADAVIINIAYCGHSNSQKVVEMCKQFKRQFEILDSMGNESFLRSVEKVLKSAVEVIV